MAKTEKELTEALRSKFVTELMQYFTDKGEEDVLRTKAGQFAIPCLDEERNDRFVRITVEIPKGSRDDGEPYDAYSVAEQYAEDCRAKAEEKKKAEEAKARKIAKDKAVREAKARAKAEHEAKKAEKKE